MAMMGTWLVDINFQTLATNQPTNQPHVNKKSSREGELLEGGDSDTADHGDKSGVDRQGEELSEEEGAEERREEGLSRLMTGRGGEKKNGRQQCVQHDNTPTSVHGVLPLQRSCSKFGYISSRTQTPRSSIHVVCTYDTYNHIFAQLETLLWMSGVGRGKAEEYEAMGSLA